MKKTHYKVVLTMVFTFVILLFSQSISNAAEARISASSTSVNVGDNVSINVSITGATWNIKINGSGVSDSVVGVNMNVENETTNKSYKLDTSKPGSYTVSLSGDVTDADGTSVNSSDSVTVNVVEKANETQQPTAQQPTQPVQPAQPAQQQPAQPTFANANKTMYTTGNINLRASWSTSSTATSVPAGTEVTVTGTSTDSVNGYVWYRVSYNGQTKYVASGLLTATKPAEEQEDKNDDKNDDKNKEDEKKQGEKSTNKALKDIVIENYKLTPNFAPEITKYELKVGKDVEKLEISAIKQDEKQKVEITGNQNLRIGNNIIKITVTAEDGTTRLYSITVTKSNNEESAGKVENMLKLSQLKINNATLEPSFNADLANYTISVNDISSVKPGDVVAVPADEGVTVTVAEENKEENSEKIITIMLENSDGTKTGVYQIMVKKAEVSSTQNNNSIYYILGAIILVLLVFIIIIIVLLRKTSDRDDIDDIKDADELSDDYDFSLRNAIEEATSDEDGNQEFDEIVEDSSLKSQIINPTDYNVFKDKGDGVGRDENIEFGDDDYGKNKKRGKHF